MNHSLRACCYHKSQIVLCAETMMSAVSGHILCLPFKAMLRFAAPDLHLLWGIPRHDRNVVLRDAGA